jgi:murein DD-endopeptidase
MWQLFSRQGVRVLLACSVFTVNGCASVSVQTPFVEARFVPTFKQPHILNNRLRARQPASAIAAQAAATAKSMVGTPYRWGGDSPRGFDCSGLVHYSYGRAGAAVPRTSQQLFSAARPVSLGDVRTGDLVFFRVGGKVSHVGIYLDDGRFVHAPSSGKRVEVASLENGWYERNFIRAGRLALR